jgi:tetratricopeptide (TPR) repeat protein
MTNRGFVARVVFAGLFVSLLPGATFSQDIDAFYEFLMARRLEAAGDTAGAFAALERAATADPDSAEVQAEIASFHLRRNDHVKAEAAGRRALALDADNLGAHRVLGLLTAAYVDGARNGSPFQMRQYAEEAIDHLERAIDSPVGATDIGLQFTLGRLYLRTGRDVAAIEVLGNVVAENPGSVSARLTLAQAYAASGSLDDAIASLEGLVDRAPRVAATLGRYQEQAGRFLAAADNYTNALELNPANRELKFRRIVAFFNAGRFGDVVSLSVEAAAEHPEDLRFDRMHAQGLFEGGYREAAYAVMRKMVASNPDDATLKLTLVDFYYNDGRSSDAERILRVLVDSQPMNANALNYLGYLLAEEGRLLDEAVTLVRRALELDPDNPSFLDSLGWAYYQRGEFEAAGQYLEPAAEQLPENSVILDHLGDLRSRQGRLAEAIAAWVQALDGDRADIKPAIIEQKIDGARSELQDSQ